MKDITEFLDEYDAQEKLRVKIAQGLWGNGFPLSHVIFQLSAEDVVSVLIDMARDGKFNVDAPEIFMPSLIASVEDDIEEVIDWRPLVRACVYQYLFEARSSCKE